MELPDLLGRRGTQFTCFTSTKVLILTPEELRRDILRIHTRAMSKNGALAEDARALLEDVTEGLPAMTEHYSGVWVWVGGGEGGGLLCVCV